MLTAIFSFLLMLLVCVLIIVLVNIPNFYIKTVIYLVIICLFIYFHPSKEAMICDANYSCQVKQEYFKIFKMEKELNLSPEARLKCDIINIPFCFKSADIKDNYYIKINIIDKNEEHKPFVFYVDIQKSDNLANNYAKSLSSAFIQYKKKPEKGFNLESKANPVYSYLLVILIILFLSLCRKIRD